MISVKIKIFWGEIIKNIKLKLNITLWKIYSKQRRRKKSKYLYVQSADTHQHKAILKDILMKIIRQNSLIK